MQSTVQLISPSDSPYQTFVSMQGPLHLSTRRCDPQERWRRTSELYDYHLPVPGTPPSSPSPSKPFSKHDSRGAPPLMTQAIRYPFTSGKFGHPTIRSPQPCESSHLSLGSSVSSVTMVPIHSHSGSDNAYHEMNREMATVNLGSYGWGHDTGYVQTEASLPSSRHHPLTVAPERLNSTMLPYSNHYGAPQLPRMEPAPMPEYEIQAYLPASSEKVGASRAKYSQVPAHIQRLRSRGHTSPSTTAFVCHQCRDPKSFAKHYNYKQHMETHKANRVRPNICPYQNCDRKFVRATDLERHHISVHTRRKDYKCDRCPALFARKDTCRRHMIDACPRSRAVAISEGYRREGRYTAATKL